VTTRPVAERPRQIIQAIALLWMSTTLGFFSSLSENDESWATLILAALVMLVLAVALSIGLWRGRNWGRVVYLVLVSLSLAAFVSAWGVAERPPVEVALEAVSFVADAGSFFLVFTKPGSIWFEDTREERA